MKKESQQLRSLSDGIRDYAILMLDKHGFVKTWSASVEILLGYKRTDVRGKAWADFYPSEDIAKGLPNRDLQIASSHGIYENSSWRVRKDVSRLWMNTVICPLWDNRGRLKGYSVVMRDMTERREREELLKVKQRELEQSRRMEAIGRLAGGVAHHFNNLITGITAVIQVVCKQMEADSPYRHDLEEVLHATSRAAGLTRQLLAFGRRQVSEMKIIDFNKVILDIQNMVRQLLPESIELVTRLKAGPLLMRGSPAQMDQMIVDLVLNARDAMPSGGRLSIATDYVRVSDDEAGSWGLRPGLHISVTIMDTGVGIREEQMAHIFEPFYTTKKEGEGTGLGLASVYGIVKQNEGHISVQSQAGKGTAFRILWPARTEAPARPSAPSVSVRTAMRGGHRILLVEDETMVRRAICRLLKFEGYQVFEAAGGRQAMDLWERMPNSPELLLTDVVMPGMSGGQLAEWARIRQPGLAVLFMSGYSEEILSHRILLNRNTDFIEKPFADDQLLEKIRAVLNASMESQTMNRRAS